MDRKDKNSAGTRLIGPEIGILFSFLLIVTGWTADGALVSVPAIAGLIGLLIFGIVLAILGLKRN